MITCYHTHSNLSDGEYSIEEMLEAAIVAGIDEIGLSDHYVLPPSCEPISWSLALDGLPGYFATLKKAKEKLKNNISVRFGIEADYFADSSSQAKKILADYPLDYIIGSIHFVDGFSIDSTPHFWQQLSQPQIDDLIVRYWELMLELSNNDFCDFIGHPDLYKKFGFLPSIDISDKISIALDSIKDNNLAIELNTSGWFKPIKEQYPSSDILIECIKRDIPIIITSDSHELSTLKRNYTQAKELLIGLGCQNTVIYSERQRNRF